MSVCVYVCVCECAMRVEGETVHFGVGVRRKTTP